MLLANKCAQLFTSKTCWSLRPKGDSFCGLDALLSSDGKGEKKNWANCSLKHSKLNAIYIKYIICTLRQWEFHSRCNYYKHKYTSEANKQQHKQSYRVTFFWKWAATSTEIKFSGQAQYSPKQYLKTMGSSLIFGSSLDFGCCFPYKRNLLLPWPVWSNGWAPG